MSQEIKTIKATAEEMGVSVYTISDFITLLGITPKPMINGRAKGLDANDRAAIRERLFPARRPARAGA